MITRLLKSCKHYLLGSAVTFFAWYCFYWWCWWLI